MIGKTMGLQCWSLIFIRSSILCDGHSSGKCRNVNLSSIPHRLAGMSGTGKAGSGKQDTDGFFHDGRVS